MLGRAIAETAHAAFACLDAAQREAEGRSDENAVADRTQKHDGKDKIIVGGLRSDDDAADRRRRHVGDAVVAAGEGCAAIYRPPDDEGERYRDQDEIDAACAYRSAVQD